MTADDLVTTNFESFNVAKGNTYDEGISGPIGCDTKFGGDWDAGTNPLDNPPGLYPRDDLANVNFFTSRLDIINWNFPYIRVRSATNSADVKGKVAYNTSGKSQGVFNYPSGSV